MSLYGAWRQHIVAVLPEGVDAARVRLEPARDAAHGELTTNAALVAKVPPQVLAERLAALPGVAEATVGGAGFVNLRLDPAVWRSALRDIARAEVPGERAATSHGNAIKEWSYSDPMFAILHAYARTHSVLRHGAAVFGPGAATEQAPLDRLDDPAELALIRRLVRWPDVAERDDSDRVRCYLAELAGAFDDLWRRDRGAVELRFVAPADRDVSMARLALVQCVATVLASGLAVIGVDPVEEMR